MCLRPMPGSSYDDAWKDQNWHPKTQFMTLTRFRQIRAVLHISDNYDHRSQTDSLWKFRCLLNCLKLTINKYISVGGNLSLDETSISSRSKYGRNFIFYNSTKPTGKYHYKFYMLCCSSTYVLLSFKMHTKENIDTCEVNDKEAEKLVELEDIDRNTTEIKNNSTVLEQKIIPKLVNEMLKQYYHTYRIVNMDRYYGGCISVMNLRKMDYLIDSQQ